MIVICRLYPNENIILDILFNSCTFRLDSELFVTKENLLLKLKIHF